MFKRILSLIMALAMALALVSCSSNSNNTDNTVSDSSVNTTVDSSVDGDTYSDSSSTDEVVDNEPLICESEAVSDVTYETASETYTAEGANVDGEDVTEYVSYPTNLTFGGDAANLPDAVTSTLEADVKAVSDMFTSEAKEFIDFANNLHANTDESVSELDAILDSSYDEDITLSVTRADSAVLSAVVIVRSYIDGYLNNTTVYTYNYDAQTGEKLTFDMLGSDFRTKAEELVATAADAKQADTGVLDDNYSDNLFYAVCDGTETNEDIQKRAYPELTEDESYVPVDGNADSTFYMTKDKILFVASQYTLSTSVNAPVELAVSYDDFGDTINSQYLPQ